MRRHDGAKPPDMTEARSAPSRPPYFAFSTRHVPVDGKFDAWRDIGLKFGGVEARADDPKAFEGAVEQWSAGPLDVARLKVRGSGYARTASLARNHVADFVFTFCSNGTTVHSERAGTATLKQGEACFYSHDHPSTVSPADNSPHLILSIERSALLQLLPRGFEFVMQTFAPSAKILKLLADTVPLITNKTEPTTHEKRETVGQHVVDLVALLLNPARDARALIEGRGLRGAHIGAVLQAIDQRFAQSNLSAETVGEWLGISDRHVHRLLEETTKTFHEHLVERRLLRAYEMLLDPSYAETKIADIALQVGYTNNSLFSYDFRRRFGDTPTGVRASATRAQGLDSLRETFRKVRRSSQIQTI